MNTFVLEQRKVMHEILSNFLYNQCDRILKVIVYLSCAMLFLTFALQNWRFLPGYGTNKHFLAFHCYKFITDAI